MACGSSESPSAIATAPDGGEDGSSERVEADNGADTADVHEVEDGREVGVDADARVIVGDEVAESSIDTGDARDETLAEGGDPDATKPPSVADNPPIPAGYKLMQQADVTAEMTAWAVSILQDPTDYPMFATATKTFGALTVLIRVEWHAPDFQNMMVHRGVTLYEPV
jgi:hypothetical protein